MKDVGTSRLLVYACLALLLVYACLEYSSFNYKIQEISLLPLKKMREKAYTIKANSDIKVVVDCDKFFHDP